MPIQSVTTMPPNASCLRSHVFTHLRLAWSGRPSAEPYDSMTDATPAECLSVGVWRRACASHHRRTCADAGGEGRQEVLSHEHLGDPRGRVVVVRARRHVAREVFETGRDLGVGGEVGRHSSAWATTLDCGERERLPLQALHRCHAHRSHQVGVFAERLVHTRESSTHGDIHYRREHPVHASVA